MSGTRYGTGPKGKLTAGATLLALRPGAVGLHPDPHALGRAEELAVLQVAAGSPPLEDVGLPGAHVHPVGREQE